VATDKKLEEIFVPLERVPLGLGTVVANRQGLLAVRNGRILGIREILPSRSALSEGPCRVESETGRLIAIGKVLKREGSEVPVVQPQIVFPRIRRVRWGLHCLHRVLECRNRLHRFTVGIISTASKTMCPDGGEALSISKDRRAASSNRTRPIPGDTGSPEVQVALLSERTNILPSTSKPTARIIILAAVCS
jgi:hypothetical protein